MIRERKTRLLLDGAIGTLLGRDCDILNITQPELVGKVHREYLEAGADVITTNTFMSQRIWQDGLGRADLVARMNAEGARIARREADLFSDKTGKRRFVAGSVGPSGDADSYLEQMSALLEGGVDAILIETVTSLRCAETALLAAETATKRLGREVALMVSLTVRDEAGHLPSGECVEDIAKALEGYPLFSLGLNCSLGAKSLAMPLRKLASTTGFRISAHPNAGLPDESGNYPETPESMAKTLCGYVEEGIADIVGGCCGTTPAHIRALHRSLGSTALRSRLPSSRSLT